MRCRNKNRIFTIVAASASLACLGLVGCDDDDAFEETGERIDEGFDDAGDAMDDAADDIEDGFDDLDNDLDDDLDDIDDN